MSVHFSSKTAEWYTPRDLLAILEKAYGKFTLDPCATAENAVCECFFTKEQDGLSQKWFGNVFMNPPYGREIGKWVRKAYEETDGNCEQVVCLLPARTDTAWFHDYCAKGKIEFLRGRLKFGGSKNSAPFPSMLVVFG
jgi:phage N-6-adenine-methyltransferase